MEYVKISEDSEVRVLSLSRGKANALNLAMVEELLSAVNDAEHNASVRALVFASATPGFFSAGFDVAEVFAYDRNAMHHFFGRFMELFLRVLRMPKPVLGALAGHTFAGGAFLALAFDARILAEGDFGFALNEINFGAILPPTLRRALINVVGPREATRMILTGETIKPHRALHIGLADQVVPSIRSCPPLSSMLTLGRKNPPEPSPSASAPSSKTSAIPPQKNPSTTS